MEGMLLLKTEAMVAANWFREGQMGFFGYSRSESFRVRPLVRRVDGLMGEMVDRCV